jgi:hypothetical protein
METIVVRLSTRDVELALGVLRPLAGEAKWGLQGYAPTLRALDATDLIEKLESARPPLRVA